MKKGKPRMKQLFIRFNKKGEIENVIEGEMIPIDEALKRILRRKQK